jgi:hypothetical protein
MNLVVIILIFCISISLVVGTLVYTFYEKPKAVADKAVADKAVADKAVADKAVADKAAADKAVADKAVADKAMAVTPIAAALVTPVTPVTPIILNPVLVAAPLTNAQKCDAEKVVYAGDKPWLPLTDTPDAWDHYVNHGQFESRPWSGDGCPTVYPNAVKDAATKRLVDSVNKLSALPIGNTVSCQNDTKYPGGVYRLAAANTLNRYSTPDIASSWDANWRNSTVIPDCSRVIFGPDMTVNPLVGKAFSCANDIAHPGVFRLTAANTLNKYLNPDVANSWDANWSNPTVLSDCSTYTFGSDIAQNQ